MRTSVETATATLAPADHPFDRLLIALDGDQLKSSLADRDQSAIAAHIPGWSRIVHYHFFRALLQAGASRVLMCGVYYGRDISYLLDARNRHFPNRKLEIVGVDRFLPSPCDDWPPAQRSLSWDEAGFGPSPTIEAARLNVSKYAAHSGEVRLVQDDDAHFLATCPETFDAIYLDSAHDGPTVERQLRVVRRLCSSSETIIAGDDFSDAGTWGVESTVRRCFGAIGTIAGMIWFSDLARLRPEIQ